MGLTKSFVSDEFIVHIKDHADYRLLSVRKEEMVGCIKMAYVSYTKRDLPIYGLTDKKLSKFRTTEKDAAKGKNKMPDAQH